MMSFNHKLEYILLLCDYLDKVKQSWPVARLWEPGRIISLVAESWGKSRIWCDFLKCSHMVSCSPVQSTSSSPVQPLQLHFYPQHELKHFLGLLLALCSRVDLTPLQFQVTKVLFSKIINYNFHFFQRVDCSRSCRWTALCRSSLWLHHTMAKIKFNLVILLGNKKTTARVL